MIQQSYFRRNNIPSVEQNRTRRDIMKKIILLCLLMLLMTVPGYASEVDDANQIVSDLKDFSYQLEAGLTYVKYGEAYNDIYVKSRRFEDKYPNSDILLEIKGVIEPYKDAKDLWHMSFSRNLGKNAADYMSKDLKVKYPGIEEKVKKVPDEILPKYLHWDNNSTISALWNISKDKIKLLENKITAN